MTDRISVVLADDHAPTRTLVRESLEVQGFEVLAEAGSAEEAIAAALAHRPHVCLVDLHMPGHGLTAVRAITQQVPESSVVVFTVSRADEHLFEALTAGALGYLLKDIDPDNIGEALRGVLAGEAALPKRLVTKLITEFRSRSRRRRLPLIGGKKVELTEKEWEVLDGLRDGLSTKEIAAKMGVSAVTVRTHIANTLKKLRVSDREAALRLLDEA